MTQIEQFLGALKKAIKAKGLVYKDIGSALGLSESSVKRILSSKALSFERLEEICRVAGVQFSEIYQLAEFKDNEDQGFYNVDQEKIFVENLRLFHYYSLLEEGHTPQKIAKLYDIPSDEAQKFLLTLDKHGLIELHPKDRVKMDRSRMKRFRKDGPLGKIIFEQARKSYLQTEFKQPDELLRFNTVKLSPTSIAKIKSRIEKMMADLKEDASFENLDSADVRTYGVLMAVRPWGYTWMEALRRRKA